MKRCEVLVAIMNNQPDFAILQNEGWYRVPVSTSPEAVASEGDGFLSDAGFRGCAYAMNYFGHVRDIREVGRRDLFPGETPNTKSGKRYYQVFLEKLEKVAYPYH